MYISPKGAARGWSSVAPANIVQLLEATLPEFTPIITPDDHSPFIEGKHSHVFLFLTQF